MPTYAYQCLNCPCEFEIVQRMKDKPKKKCPECGKMKLAKVPQPFGMKFVGPGFHANDYP